MIYFGCGFLVYIFIFYYSSYVVIVDYNVVIDYECGKLKVFFYYLFFFWILCWYENNCFLWEILDIVENFVFVCVFSCIEIELVFGLWWKSEGICVGWN